MNNIFNQVLVPDMRSDPSEDAIIESEEKRTLEDAKRDSIDGETELKKDLANKTFEFMVQFTTFVGVILGAYVAQHIFQNKSIPDNVLITLITTTFATVVGLMVIILKGLFGGKES